MALLTNSSERGESAPSLSHLAYSLSNQEFIRNTKVDEDLKERYFAQMINLLSKQDQMELSQTTPSLTSYQKWEHIKKLDQNCHSKVGKALVRLECSAENDPFLAEKLIALAIDDLTEEELNSKDDQGKSLIHVATQQKTSILFHALMATNKIDIDVQDNHGRTAAHLCLLKEDADPLKLRQLIQIGANLDITDDRGITVEGFIGNTNQVKQAKVKVASRARQINRFVNGLKTILQNEPLYHGKLSDNQKEEIFKDAPSGTFLFYSPEEILPRKKLGNTAFKLAVKLESKSSTTQTETTSIEEKVEQSKKGKVKSYTCTYNTNTNQFSVKKEEVKNRKFRSLQEVTNAIESCKKPFPFYLNLTNKDYTTLF